jgi:hypothetical protein
MMLLLLTLNTILISPVNTPGGTATSILVRQGQVVMTLASDSPTGNVAKGQSNVVLLKFKMRAAGEAVRIKWLPFKLEKAAVQPGAQVILITILEMLPFMMMLVIK